MKKRLEVIVIINTAANRLRCLLKRHPLKIANVKNATPAIKIVVVRSGVKEKYPAKSSGINNIKNKNIKFL